MDQGRSVFGVSLVSRGWKPRSTATKAAFAA